MPLFWNEWFSFVSIVCLVFVVCVSFLEGGEEVLGTTFRSRNEAPYRNEWFSFSTVSLWWKEMPKLCLGVLFALISQAIDVLALVMPSIKSGATSPSSLNVAKTKTIEKGPLPTTGRDHVVWLLNKAMPVPGSALDAEIRCTP